MNNRLRLVVTVSALALASAPRADTIQASSTTMGIVRQDSRAGAIQTAIPIYEMLDLSATDVKTSFADNLELVLSTWGSVDAANQVRFWQNGAQTDSRFTGDINVGFVKADFLNRAVSVRVGRQLIADGAARMIHLDGGELQLKLPGNFGLSGYAGSPVVPRFSARQGEQPVGNARGNFATGGRVSWGLPGLVDFGVSYAYTRDIGDLGRSDVGADVRFSPQRAFTLAGSLWYSLYENRIGEGSVAAIISPIHQVDFTLDARLVQPDLYLSRSSILSVFANSQRTDLGGAVHWAALRNLVFDVDYHALLQDEGTGNWVRGKVTYRPKPSTSLGGEGSYLENAGTGLNGNGYKMARLFAAQTLAALTGTLDLYGYFFNQSVNGQDKTLTGTATVGYAFARGWRAVVAGTAGTTAYLSSQFELMAKLVYDQTYAIREVR